MNLYQELIADNVSSKAVAEKWTNIKAPSTAIRAIMQLIVDHLCMASTPQQNSITISDDVKSTNEYVTFLSGTSFKCGSWSKSREYAHFQNNFLVAALRLRRGDVVLKMAPLLKAIAVNPKIDLSFRAAIARFISALLICFHKVRTVASMDTEFLNMSTLTDALTSVLTDLKNSSTKWCQNAYKFLIMLVPSSYIPPHFVYAQIWKFGLLSGFTAIQTDLLKILYIGCNKKEAQHLYRTFCHENHEIWTMMATKSSEVPVIVGSMNICLFLLSLKPPNEDDHFVVHELIYGQIFHESPAVEKWAAKFWHRMNQAEMWPKLLNLTCKFQPQHWRWTNHFKWSVHWLIDVLTESITKKWDGWDFLMELIEIMLTKKIKEIKKEGRGATAMPIFDKLNNLLLTVDNQAIAPSQTGHLLRIFELFHEFLTTRKTPSIVLYCSWLCKTVSNTDDFDICALCYKHLVWLSKNHVCHPNLVFSLQMYCLNNFAAINWCNHPPSQQSLSWAIRVKLFIELYYPELKPKTQFIADTLIQLFIDDDRCTNWLTNIHVYPTIATATYVQCYIVSCEMAKHQSDIIVLNAMYKYLIDALCSDLKLRPQMADKLLLLQSICALLVSSNQKKIKADVMDGLFAATVALKTDEHLFCSAIGHLHKTSIWHHRNHYTVEALTHRLFLIIFSDKKYQEKGAIIEFLLSILEKSKKLFQRAVALAILHCTEIPHQALLMNVKRFVKKVIFGAQCRAADCRRTFLSEICIEYRIIYEMSEKSDHNNPDIILSDFIRQPNKN